MIHIEPGLYLRVQQNPERPHPLPLENGFSIDNAYRALGIYSPSETSECYFILANDSEEMWFVSNRHFRAVGLFPSGAIYDLLSTTLLPTSLGLCRRRCFATVPDSPAYPLPQKACDSGQD